MATVEQTAARIEDVRVTMRRLYGDRWPEVSAPYREILEGAMRGSGSSKRLVHPFAPCLLQPSLWDGRWRTCGHKKTAVLTAVREVAIEQGRPEAWPQFRGISGKRRR